MLYLCCICVAYFYQDGQIAFTLLSMVIGMSIMCLDFRDREKMKNCNSNLPHIPLQVNSRFKSLASRFTTCNITRAFFFHIQKLQWPSQLLYALITQWCTNKKKFDLIRFTKPWALPKDLKFSKGLQIMMLLGTTVMRNECAEGTDKDEVNLLTCSSHHSVQIESIEPCILLAPTPKLFFSCSHFL